MYLHANHALVLAASGSGAHFAAKDPAPAPAAPAPEEDGEEDKNERGHGRRALLIVLGILVALLAAGYAYGVETFSSVYYPGTRVLGVDISLMDAETAAEAIAQTIEDYTLEVSGNYFSWTYTPEDASSLIDARGIAEAVLATNDPYLWPVHLIEYLTIERTGDGVIAESDVTGLSDSFDTSDALASLAEAVAAYNETCTGAFDAASAYDAEAGAFTVEQARTNELLDADAVQAAVLTALEELSETLVLDDSCYQGLAGGASDEELQAACDAANELLGTDVVFTMDGYEAVTLDSAQLAEWISFDEELVPTLDTAAAASWAETVAEEQLNTVGTERTYTRPDGVTCTVSGGTWGWEVDVDAFVAAVLSAIEEKQTGEVAITVTTSADVYSGAGEADWGAYIDVDLTEQHAYYYDADGNLLWDSGIITANVNKGYATPEGVYYIRSMYKNITLYGPYDEETDTYEWKTPVSYWMAFIGTSVGFHDATWQADEYFEDATAYLSHGSHGCVNLPLEAAEELYSLVYSGLCVVVHW